MKQRQQRSAHVARFKVERAIMVTTSHREQWAAWLAEQRHISVAVARAAKLSYTKDRLIIPVLSEQGDVLFKKYRRAPWITDGPKYLYEKGAKASLYGVDAIGDATTVIVVESELDSLAMRTLGYASVSTTGGASTWPDDWAAHFTGKTPIIMYDADKPGIEGAMRVFLKLENAKMAWAPVEYGKDATEIIHNGGTDAIVQAIDNARSYPRELSELAFALREERMYAMSKPNLTPFHVDIAFEYITHLLYKVKQDEKRATKKRKSDSRLESARSFPIRELIKVRGGFAKCVYHNEKTSSMRVYADNHAFSFCCGKRSDAIDIYRALNNCTFNDAVDFLSR